MRARGTAFLAVALLLAACGGGSSDNTTPTKNAGTAAAPSTGPSPTTSASTASAGANVLKPTGGGFFTDMFGTSTPITCPRVAKIGEASQLTRFAPSGQDLTDVLFEAVIGDINGTCSASAKTVTVQMTADFIASRGPADKTRKAPFTYFVAIIGPGDKVLTRDQFDTSIEFAGNKTRSGIREPLDLTIPLQQGERGDDLRILVGFVLSHEEVAYNRAHSQ